MRIFENTNYDFLGKRKMFYAISLAIIVIGFTVLFITKSIPLGIDFSGGTELQIKFEKEVNIGDLREAMDNAGFAANWFLPRRNCKSFVCLLVFGT